MDFSPSSKPMSKSFDIPPMSKTRAINLLLYGTKKMLNKVCKDGRYVHKSHFFLLEEPTGYFLQWLSRKKVLQSSRIALDKTIQIHDQNHKLRKQYLIKLEEKKRLLTVKYGNKHKKLVLEFENEEERDFFRFGLEYFVRRSQILYDLSQTEKFFFSNFIENLSNLAFNKNNGNGKSNSNNEVKFKAKHENAMNSTNYKSIFGSNSKKNTVQLYHSINDFKEAKEICGLLGVNIDIDYLNFKYEEFLHKKGIYELDFEKFKDFLIELLARKEAIEIYRNYCEEEEKDLDLYAPYMTNIQLQEFYKKEQSQTIKIEDIKEIIKKSFWSWSNLNSSIIINQLDESLSFMIFSRILSSENNTIFSHEKSLVYQNMDKPLSDYYINGLTRCFSQEIALCKLKNFEGFLTKAIDKGSRYFEFLLTSLDDDQKEAILSLPNIPKEDMTSSTKLVQQPILFKDILKILKKNAFLNNPYPIFLSIKILKDSSLSEDALQFLLQDILGLESLFSLPSDHKNQNFLPSPKTLERKFLLILAGNMPDFKTNSEFLLPLLNTTEVSENENSEVSDEGILEENSAKLMPVYFKQSNKANFKVMNSNNQILRLDDGGSEEDEEEEKRACVYKHNYEQNLFLYLDHLKDLIKDLNNQVNANNGIDKNKTNNTSDNFSTHQKMQLGELPSKMLLTKTKETNLLKNKQKIKAIKSSALLALGCFFEAKIPLDKQDDDVFKINLMSLKELHRHSEKELVQFHKKHLSLVYNLILNDEKTMVLYQTGAQINNLLPNNLMDLAILANFAKFQENGGVNSGYLLKPNNFLHDSKEEFLSHEAQKPKVLINITVLSGLQLKSPSIKKNIISPFVKIGLKGFEFDEQNNRIYKTNTVQNNGFNPIFEDKTCCEFVINRPELAVLYMEVWDEAEEIIEAKFLGWFGVPVTCMRSGFRVAPLRDANLQIIDKSLLFCQVKVRSLMEEEEVKKNEEEK